VTDDPVESPRWRLTLYVNGASPRSAEAIETVRTICDEDLAGDVDLNIVNAVDQPAMVVKDHILALPTLVKHSPVPLRHLVGHLTDATRVRAALDLAPKSSVSAPTLTEGGTVR